jgi:hypothetical protein
MTMNRESLLDKIRALLSKTVANGCTEAEMMAALAMARAMRDAHKVTDEELALDDRFHESCHKRGIHLSFLTPI